MKVLFVSYPHVGLGRGGMARQIIMTKKALESLGHEVVLHNFLMDSIEEYDVCHVFGASASSKKIVDYMVAAGKPVIISTVFNSFDQNKFKLYLQRVLVKRVPGFLTEAKSSKVMLGNADVVIALNKQEQLLLEKYFDVPSKKIRLIPNGIDVAFSSEKAEVPKEDLVLCVGEVCKRKNQLSLIKAIKSLGCKLAIVGPMNDLDYKKMCIDEADGNSNVTFYGELPYGSSQLVTLYAKAKVFCLPSVSEVQPLTLIEASSYNCNLAVSNQFPLQEFLTDGTEKFHPKDIDGMRRSIIQAMSRDSYSRNSLKGQLTWDDVGGLLQSIYRESKSL